MTDKSQGGRPKIAETVHKRTGRTFVDLLDQYAAERRTPESLANDIGCTVPALLANAAACGFEVVRTFRKRLFPVAVDGEARNEPYDPFA